MIRHNRSTRGRHFAVLCQVLCAWLVMAATTAFAQGFSTSAWTGDATVPEAASTVVWAYSLGDSATATINGVTFTGVAGGNPAVSGKFSLNVTGVYNSDTNNITSLGGSGSAVMAANFVYGNPTAALVLEGLTVGRRYSLNVYTMGWEAAGQRQAQWVSGSDSATLDVDQFGDNNGARINYAFTADATTRTIQVNALSGNTWHFYGLALTAGPTVTSSTAALASSATTLTISGTNFSTTPGNNTVAFTPAGTGTVTAATATSLTVTGISGLTTGALNAVVTTNGLSSGSAVQVAAVVAPGSLDTLDLAVNSTVYAFAVQPDGKTIVAGNFTQILGQGRNYVARLNTDGTLDTSFNPNPNNFVYGVGVQADGKVILAGGFTTVSGTARNYVARVGADGTLDTSFNPNAGSTVEGVALQTDGKILLKGGFSTMGGTARNYIARINTDGTLDTSFNPNPNGSVYSMAVQADGKILLGGDFSAAGGVLRSRAARFNADGTPDLSFNPNVSSTVNVMVVQPDGKILLGGAFTTVGGAARSRIARVNANGTLDTSFDPNANGAVFSAAAQADGKILLGGSFTTMGGTARNYIARINTDGTLDTSFDPNASNTVVSVVVQADGKILLAGALTTVGGTARSYAARLLNGTATQSLAVLDSTQVAWSRGGTGPEVVGVTYELSTDGGSTYTSLGAGERASGSSALMGLSLPASGQIRARGRTGGGYYNGSSGLVESVQSFSGVAQPVREITVSGNNANIYSGATTTSASTNTDFGLAVVGGASVARSFTIGNTGTSGLTLTGTAPSYVTLGGAGAAHFSVSSQPASGSVAAGGSQGFTVTYAPTVVGTHTATVSIASDDADENPFTFILSGTGAVAGSLDTLDPVANASVYATAVQADGKVILGGLFTSVGGTARNCIARINTDGTLDTSFNPNASSTVNSVVVQADGKILLGGAFTTMGGTTTRNRIARLNADGTLDTTFDPNVGNTVNCVAVQADGKILLGGSFTTVGGTTTRNRIARLNADGTLDTTFDPNAIGTVNSVVVQTDGKILLGGSFSQVSATVRSRIARLNADGTLDTTFNPNASSTVNCLALQADGKILLGGGFTTVGGTTTRNRIARLEVDGTVDGTFDPNLGSGGGITVNSMAVQANGKILLGGTFTAVGASSTVRNYIARVNTDGTLDTSFDPNASFTVNSVAVQADGKILLGGGFTTVGGTSRNYFARLLNNTATQSLSVPDSTQVTWNRGGAGPEVQEVTFELSTNGGSSYSSLGAGARVSGGWSLTGLNLPASGQIRARGRTSGGQYSGSSGLVESVQSYSGLAAPAPTVASISPTSGSTAGGTSVTLTGTGFTGATGVTIGGAAATSVNVVSDTSITCTTPAGSVGTASVVVTNPSGSNAVNTLFTYFDPVVAATYASAASVPVTAAGYTATGRTVNFTLGFAPPTGTNLTVVNNTGTGFISGTFGNLANGAPVNLTYNSVTYPFVAWYYGGDGNDLQLLWPYTGLASWGRNAEGQVGDSSTAQRNVPVQVDRSGVLAGKTIVQVARGGYHTLALTSEGQVYAWGLNDSGQLGDTTTTNRSAPVAVSTAGVLSGKTVVRVAGGYKFNAALCSDGSLVTWGSNTSGQLGDNTNTQRNVPVLVNTASGTSALFGKTVVALACGYEHMLALCGDGTVAAWGFNSLGTVGDNTTTQRKVPVLVNTASGTSALFGKTVVGVSAGNLHSLAWCSDGTAVAWGNGGSGQVGDNTNTQREVPVLVSTTNGVSALFGKTVTRMVAGHYHSLALCSDGTLTAWGSNGVGELGDRSQTNRGAPVAVNAANGLSALFGKTVVDMAAGNSLSFALCSDGSVAAWGGNNEGQLGDNLANNYSIAPVLVNTTSGLSALAGVSTRALAGSGFSATHMVVLYGTGVPPVLASISPTTGVPAGGTSVTLTGTGFTGATGVTIGGAAATSVTGVSDTSITCTTPAGSAGTASVVVTTPAGSNAVNTLYTYVWPVPTITAILPPNGSTAGGSSVTIIGTGFTGTTAVTLGGVAATGVTVISDTMLTATTGAHASGAANVAVTTPGGTATGTGIYTYGSAPVAAGGTWVEQTGAGSITCFSITSSADGLKLAAAAVGGSIWTSTDAGGTWTERTAAGTRAWYCITSSADGSKLAAGAFGGNILTSADGGATWTVRSAAGTGDWLSITSSADGSRLAAVQYGGRIFTSADGGATWTPNPASNGREWAGIASSADGMKLVAVAKNQNVWTSTDGGGTWTPRAGSAAVPYQVCASSADGTKLAAAAYGGYIYTSADSGATWTERSAPGYTTWTGITSSADGSNLAAVADGSSSIWTTNDGGNNWTERTSAGTRSWTAITSSADGGRLAAAVGGGYIYTSQGATPPTITTPTSASIAATSATLGGNVTSDGGDAISERGVVYAVTTTNGDPLINGSGVTKVTATGTTGVFTAPTGVLTAATGYSFKAYATNSAGTTYTSVASFTTSASFNTTPGSPVTYSGVISGSNTVTNSGGGTLTLTGANTYTGSTNVQAGTVSVNTVSTGTNAQSLGAGNVVNLGVANTSSGSLVYTGGAGTLDKTINSLGNGSDTVQNSGSGLLTLSGTLNKTGTTLTLKGGSSGITVSGTITGNTGTPNSDLIVDGGVVTLTNANTYNGPTYIRNSGTLNANAVDALPTQNGRTAVTFDGTGTSVLSLGTAQSVASLTSAGTATVTLNANTLTIGAASGSTTFAGVIGGTGGLIKDGASTQTLTGSNTFTGNINITAGTLEISGTGSVLQSSNSATVTIASGATALLSGTALNALGYSGTEQWVVAGTVNSTGGAAQTIASGGVTLDGGTLTSSSSNATYGSYHVSVNSGTITANGTGNLISAVDVGIGNTTVTLSTPLAGDTLTASAVFRNIGTGALTKTGAGTLIMTGASTYTGTTTISGGTLQIGSGGTTGSLSASSSITNNGTLAFSRSNTLTQGTDFASVISGSGAVSQAGVGTTILNGANTYTGATTISTGVLNIRHATALGTTAAGTSVTSGAALQIQGGITVGAEALTLNGTGVSNDGALRNISGTNTYGGLVTLGSATRINTDASSTLYLTNTGTITGSGSGLTVGGAGNTTIAGIIGTGTGTLTKDGAGDLILTGANTYTGTTTISGGRLVIGSGGTTGSLSTSSAIVNNATLAFWRSNTLTQGTDFASVISGSGAVSQAGVGTTILNGANTYTGATTISTGVLNIRHATALGTTAAGTSVLSGTALQIEGGITVGAEALTLNGTGVSSDGALRNISGTNTYGGLVTLGSATQINSDAGSLTLSNTGTITGSGFGLTVGGAGNTSISSSIGTGTGSLTKDGSGTLTLSAQNTYTGGTTVNGGTLALGSGGPTGILRGALTINSGATVTANTTNWSLGWNGASNGVSTIAINGGTLSFNGLSADGGTEASSISMTGGTISGSVFDWWLGITSSPTLTTLASSTSSVISSGINFRLNGGILTMNVASGTVPTGVDLLVSGVIQATGGNAGGGVTKTGAGTAVFSAANTYTGATTISAGTLQIGNGGTTGSLSTSSSITNNATLAFNRSNTVTQGTDFASVISGSGAVVQAGSGTLVLSGTNTYTGATTVSTGALSIQNGSALGTVAAGTTVASGAALQIQGGITVGAEALTLNGTGVSNDGALRNISGTNTYGGLVTLGSATRINSDAGSLSLSNTGTITGSGLALTVGGAGGTTIAGIIGTGTGTLTKDGAGTLTLTGANTYTGTTTVNGGTLNLSGAGNSSSSAIVMASGANLIFTATDSRSFANSLTGTAGTITFNVAGNTTATGGASGVNFDLNPTGTYTGTLVVNTGLLGVRSNTVFGDTANVIQLNAASGQSSGLVMAGNVTLPSTRSIQLTTAGGNGIFRAYASSTFQISGQISGAGNFVKTDGGTVVLDGTNTYTGSTNVSFGTLQIGSGGTTGSLSSSSSIVTDASLVFDRSNTITQGTDFGSVISGTGTLTKQGSGTLILTGANTYSGSTTVSAGTLQIGNGGTTGSLSASSSITNNAALVFNRTDTLTQGTNFGSVISGTGTLTKQGSGTLVLNGTNTYSGATTVSTGVLSIRSVNALGSTAAGTTVNSGAALQIQGVITTAAEALTLNGTGVSNDGALRNITGTNTFAGLITLGSATRINSDAFTLTLSNTGTITGAGFGLTVGGSGSVVINSVIGTGSGTLDKDGIGTLTLTAANTYTGATTVGAGVVNISNATALGTTLSGTSVSNGATLQLQGGITVGAEALTLNGGNAAGQTGALVNVSGTNAYGGAITIAASSSVSAAGGSVLNLTGGLVKNGTILTFNGGGTINVSTVGISGASANSDLVVDGTTVNLNVASSYNGPTFIRNSGTLNANVADALPTANGRTAVTFDGTGTSVLTLGANQSAASLTSAGAATITLNANTLTLGAASGNTTFAGSIGGTGGLTKDGASTQVLSGANTYTGATTLTAGSLVVNGSIASSSLTANGGTLLGTGTVGTIQLNSGATINPGGVSTAGTLSTGSISIVDGRLAFNLGGTSSYDSLTTTGAINLTAGGSGAQLVLNAISGYVATLNDSFTLVSNDLADAISGAFAKGTFGGTKVVTLSGVDYVEGLLGSGYYGRISYDGGTGNDVVLKVVTPEITITESATNVADGGTYNFGPVDKLVPSVPLTKTFTIKNDGEVDLTGIVVNAPTGAAAADYTVNTTGTAAALVPGASTTFTITFDPARIGTRTAAIVIDNNDLDENPFNIALTGVGSIARDASLAWVQSYGGPTAPATRRNGVARAMAVQKSATRDEALGVFATGYTTNAAGNRDIYTARYHPETGALIWAQTFNGAPNSDDEGWAIALDASGNVVITGYTSNGGINWDVYVAKYANADGTLLWSKTYAGAGGSTDAGTSVAVDSSGNVAVAGYGVSAAAGMDFFAARYAAADGSTIFERLIEGGNNRTDAAHSVAVDSAGNLAVAGNARNAANNQDFRILHLAAATGATNWQWNVNGTTSGDDDAWHVAFNPAGQVIATGAVRGANSDLYTVKLDSAGGLLWEKLWNSSYDSTDAGYRVAVDSQGHVLVAGVSYQSSGYADGYVVKFDGTSGTQLWNRRFDGASGLHDTMYTLDLDALDNAVATGVSQNTNGSYDIETAKMLSGDGAVLWDRRFDGGAGLLDDFGYAVAVSPDGNVFVGGFTTKAGTPNNTTDFLVLGYSVILPASQTSQTITFANPGAQSADTPLSLSASSSSGLTISFSVVSGPAALDPVVSGRLNFTGNGPVTVRASQSGSAVYAAAVPVDQTFTVSQSAQTIAFTLPVELSQTAQWPLTGVATSGLAVTYSVQSGPGSISGGILSFSGAGAVTVRASQAGDARYNAAADVDAVVTAVNHAPIVILDNIAENWRDFYAGSGVGEGNDIALQLSGNDAVAGFVAGYTTTTGTGKDIYLAKYDNAGTLLWSVVSGTSGNDEAMAVVVDGNGDIVIGGYTTGASGQDVYVAKHNGATGARIWSYSYNGAGNGNDVGVSLALDGTTNVVVGGYAVGAGTSNDFFAAKLNLATGAAVWTSMQNRATTFSDVPARVVVGTDGSVALAGISGSDAWTVKLAAADGTRVWQQIYNYANKPDAVRGLAMDGANNVIIAAYSQGANYDMYTAKYAALDGTLIWGQRYNSSFNSSDAPWDMTLDEDSNVFVTGTSYRSASVRDGMTLKYSGLNGTLLWEGRFNGPNNANDENSSVALDGIGNPVVSGYTTNADGTTDVYLAKHNKGPGDIRWQRTFDAANNKSDVIKKVRVDPNGNVWMTGSATTSGGQKQVLVLRHIPSF